MLPDSPDICYDFIKSNYDDTTIMNNMLDLYPMGESSISSVLAAIISCSFTNFQAMELIQSRIQSLLLLPTAKIKPCRHHFRRHTFKTSRQSYADLINRKQLEKSYRMY